MPARTTAPRALAYLVLLACVVAAGVGIWYVRSGGGVDDVDDDGAGDDVDTVELKPDGGIVHHHAKKRTGHKKGKGKGPGHPPAAPAPAPAAAGGMSYEAAIAGNNLQLTPGTKDAPDLTDTQLAGPMRNGTFLDACGVPQSKHVTVKVAIREGHAVGVSVYMAPPDPQASSCVERRVRGLYWPSSPKMDSFVTTY